MIRNLKFLGLVLAAIAAMSAMVASAASAQFESEATETQLTVSSNEAQVFKYEEASAANWTCSKVALDETVIKGEGGGMTATSVTATPTYSGCLGPLNTPITIEFKGCDYKFLLAKGATSGNTKMECPEGKGPVTITVGSLCIWTLKAQEVGTVKYTNIGTATTREIKLDPEVTKIAASRTGSALCGATTSTTGAYKGSVTITGEIPGRTTHVGVFVD